MKQLIVSLIVFLTASAALPIASADDNSPALAPIHLSPERQQLIGHLISPYQIQNRCKNPNFSGSSP